MALTAGYTFLDGEKILAKKLNLAFSGGSAPTPIAFNGTVGAITPNTGAFTTISATGQITSTLATGTAPLVIASTTNIPNLNAALLNGTTWTAPGAIGGGTPAAGSFNALNMTGLVDASGAGAGQVKFPVIQNPSANTNTLDDYIEGTWTPSVGGSATYTNQDGRYTKIGRLVTISGFLFINAIGTGSTSVISGLPYAPAVNSGVTVSFWLGLAASYVYVGGTTAAAASTITLCGATAAAASLTTPAAAMGSGTILTFSGIYQV